jgi:hypothetical protein
MIDIVDTPASVMPSATPTEADLAAWQALSRDEQLRRLRASLSQPDCSTVSSRAMSEILSCAQAAAKQRNG